MRDKDFFTLSAEHLTLEGRSRAGHETFFRIRELGLALDVGRGPDLVVPMPFVFVSHLHLDHGVGIPFYAGQRQLQRLPGGAVHVPAEVAGEVREILGVYERIAGRRFEIDVRGLSAGDEVEIGRGHRVRVHDATHRVPARAYELLEVRHHLRPELAGLDGPALAALRREGTALEERREVPLLFYTGDTDRGILERNEALFRAEVLLIECSFVKEGHQERAAAYRHIHIDDIADFAGRFENQLVVLTHFSRRYSREEIRDAVRRRVPPSLRERIRLALPEPWQTL